MGINPAWRMQLHQRTQNNQHRLKEYYLFLNYNSDLSHKIDLTV